MADAIVVGSGANLSVRAAWVEDALLTPETTLLLQMEVDPNETAALIHRARARGCRIVLNLAPAAPLEAAALRAVDILTVNENEWDWLAANAGADPASLVPTVIRTLGGDGSEVFSNGTKFHVPAQRIDPVDTTAAGDCFVGVLAAGLDRGLDLRAALTRATGAAALCCTRSGSQGSVPWAAETQQFLAIR